MTRGQLEHVIRAAAAIAGDREIVVVGSQAILGQFPDAPICWSPWKPISTRATTPNARI